VAIYKSVRKTVGLFLNQGWVVGASGLGLGIIDMGLGVKGLRFGASGCGLGRELP
jgi:hypothetical protein